MVNLRYDLFNACYHKKDNVPPGDEMKALGISWQYAVGHSMADEIWFWNCRNVPEVLPPYITVIKEKQNPYEHIGHGLSKDMADAIAAEMKDE